MLLNPRSLLRVVPIALSEKAPVKMAEAPRAKLSVQAPVAHAPAAPSQAAAIASSLILKTGAGTPSTPKAPEPVVAEAPKTAPVSVSGPRTWEGFIEFVRQTRPLLSSILEHGSIANNGANPGVDIASELAIYYRPEESYYHKQLQNRSYVDQLLTLTKDYFGKPVRLAVEIKDGGESVADRKERVLKEREEKARAAVHSHPIIQEAKSLFGGELGPIELVEEGG